MKGTICDQNYIKKRKQEGRDVYSLGVRLGAVSYTHLDVYKRQVLYRPYLVKAAGGEMAMVFRDHHLSNRIGFEYQHFRPEDAAADLVHRLHKIAENLAWSAEEHLVTISLDGENAWEWYSGCLLYTSSPGGKPELA